MRFFHIGFIAIGLLFCMTMIAVTFVAFNRKSGVTGLDPAKIQEMRIQARLIQNTDISQNQASP